jgi:SAM-dependent methyltransferase
MTTQNPYDELPYKSIPIEWTAPERLALASLLHGGPRQQLDTYRVLELGCGNGANLLPLAYYRRHASFIGVDGAQSQIQVATARKSVLGLSNVEFIHSNFRTASQEVSGRFDYILAHGVFSWISHDARDALLELCARHLKPGGLLYLNYNARPGWNVRGLVREFLLAQTSGTTSLATRAEQAQEVSAKVASSLATEGHPYSQLIANEFRFVCDNPVSYVAHEYLTADNHAYWRSEFLEIVARHGFEYVADADYNYPSGRIPEGLVPRLVEEQIIGRTLEETVDLLCYRQLHSPILTHDPGTPQPPTSEELAGLRLASCLEPCPPSNAQKPVFQHPSGYQVEAKEEVIRAALMRLRSSWPRGLRIGKLFPDVSKVTDDLRLLHRNGLVELRCIEPGDFRSHPEGLNRLEGSSGDYVTTPYHTREPVARNSEPGGADSDIRSRGQQHVRALRRELTSPGLQAPSGSARPPRIA